MSEEIKRLEYFNEKRWKTSTMIPIERVEDKDFLKYIKSQLKERCVREYVENVEDAFEYRISTNKLGREAEVSIIIEDLFHLKDKNKKLKKDLSGVIDLYLSLKNRFGV